MDNNDNRVDVLDNEDERIIEDEKRPRNKFFLGLLIAITICIGVIVLLVLL